MTIICGSPWVLASPPPLPLFMFVTVAQAVMQPFVLPFALIDKQAGRLEGRVKVNRKQERGC